MSRLFTPMTVAGLELVNRVVMPPMATNLASSQGALRPEQISHYIKRAQANLGFVIVEHTYVHPLGRVNRHQLGLYEDSLAEPLARLVQKLKGSGARTAIQLTHGGSSCSTEAIDSQPLAPSPICHPRRQAEVPRGLSLEEMAEIKECFVLAARRAKAIGFEAIELHGAHGYLLNQFLSPLSNQRQDEYGGSLANRLRYPLEVVGAVRAELGEGYPLLYRLGADDMIEGGITPVMAQEAAKALVAAGVDLLDISGGFGGAGRGEETGPYFAPLARAIKDVVQVPIICTGGITKPQEAEDVLSRQDADLIGVGRALLADPLWARKARYALDL